MDWGVVSRATAGQLSRVNQARQVEILEKMKEIENFTASYARLLVRKTLEAM